jgi:hypothetical protein
MNPTFVRRLALPILIFALLGSNRAFAQAPLEPAQLPARTTFYLIWRGTPPAEARKVNSLLALWDDPDLAPLRAAIFQNMQNSSPKDSSAQPLTREEAEQFSSLLENSLVLGYVRKPDAKVASATARAEASDHPSNGMFFAYDRTGKELLLAKAILRLRSQEKDPPKISQIAIAGSPVMKIERKDSVTFWGEHGKFAVSAGDSRVFEDIVTRLDGKPATSSLAQIPAFQEAAPLVGGGVLEFFVRVPQLRDLAPPDAPNSPIKAGTIFDALKLDAIHSVCGRLTLEGAKARVQAAMLGDVASGTLFDFWPAGQQSPASLPLVSADTVSYSAGQFNLPAIYEIVKRAVRVAMPQMQQGGTDMIEAMAAGRIGMPLPDALNLPSGEFASIQNNRVLDPQKAVYYLGIRKKPETLHLIRSIFGDQLSSERNEGDTTFLKVSHGGGQSSTGVAQWNFYHLAVRPNFILGTSRNETLREFLAKSPLLDAPAHLDLPPAYLAARAQFPETLNSISFLNFQKIDWPGLKARWIDQAGKLSEKKTSTAAEKSVTSKVPDWLANVNPEVFPRHLHFIAGASWKDSKGIHVDEWLE